MRENERDEGYRFSPVLEDPDTNDALKYVGTHFNIDLLNRMYIIFCPYTSYGAQLDILIYLSYGRENSFLISTTIITKERHKETIRKVHVKYKKYKCTYS